MRRFSIIFLGIVLGVSTLLAQDEPWKEAAAQMKAHHYSAALENLDAQLKTTSQDVLVLRLKGMCLIELNRSAEAIPVLEQALKIDPQNTASRFYLARANAEAGNFQQAISLLKRVQRDEPSSAYAAQAKKLLPSLQNLSETTTSMGIPCDTTRRWHIRLGLAGEYDDNVANRSAVALETRPTARSFRMVTLASFDIRMIDQDIDKAPLTVGASYNFYDSLHENDAADDFNYMSHAAALYFTKHGHLWDKPVDALLSAGYARDWLGGDELSGHPDLNLSTGIKYLPWTYVSIFGHFQWIDYQNQPSPYDLNARDGDNQSVGLLHSFYFFNDKWIVTADYSHSWYHTTGSLYTSQGNSAGICSQVALPWWKMTWNTGFRYIQDDYDEYTPVPTRADDLYMFTTGINYPLWIPGLNAELKYVRTMASSNKDFGDYDRNIITLGVCYVY